MLLEQLHFVFILFLKFFASYIKFRFKPDLIFAGCIAQLVERCLCKADVSGSNPLTSSCLLYCDLKLNELRLVMDTLAFEGEEGRSY